MSCNLITYDTQRRKVARPVTSREEYLALRDSEQNRRAEKKHMVQMNYSLIRKIGNSETRNLEGAENSETRKLGNSEIRKFGNSETRGEEGAENSEVPKFRNSEVPTFRDSEAPKFRNSEAPTFLLRGAKSIGNSVGMDIDHIDDVDAVANGILGKKEALGLLMLEKSASGKGLHLVFRRHQEMSQEENLRWASGLLGVEYDKGAKDVTRVFYTPPSEKMLYLDDELFDQSEVTPATPVTALQCYSSESPHQDTPPSGADHYNGIAFADIIAKYWEMYNDGKEPCEGDRNVKTYELAMTIRSICDYSVERMMQVIPNYWLKTPSTTGEPDDADEYRKTLENACREPRKGMPYRLRQVLMALRKETAIKATGGTWYAPPELPKRLPPLIKLLTKNVPSYYKAAVASQVFAALATHTHGVKFRYWDNVEWEPKFQQVLIARQSAGKGCIKQPIDNIIRDIRERDQPQRQREAEWKRKNPSGKGKAKDPRPEGLVIQILIDNLTDAVFNQRNTDASSNGGHYLYLCVDEIEALKKVTSRGTIDEVSLLIRKAHDNSIHGQERVGSDSVTGIAPLRWNWNASTTPPNARRFFAKAVNDGTLGRLDLATIIKKPGVKYDDPIYGIYDDRFYEELKPYLERLDAASGLIECPQAKTLALKIKAENEDTQQLYDSDGYEIMSYRANLIAWMKGMLLYIAHGYKWSKDIENFVRWAERYNLWCKMMYFGQQLEQEMKAEREMQSKSGPQNLLDLLNDEFTMDDYRRMRALQGKDGDGKTTLRVWKNRGYIDWDEIQNCYRKTELYLNRKEG